jgi:hypothetical protein
MRSKTKLAGTAGAKTATELWKCSLKIPLSLTFRTEANLF